MSNFLDIIYLTKHTTSPPTEADRPVQEIEITPQMIEAGVAGLLSVPLLFQPDSPTPYEDGVKAVLGAVLKKMGCQALFR